MTRTQPDTTAEGITLACNDVRIVGRLSKPAQVRELPSGDVLVTFVVVVERPPAARGRAPASSRPQTQDSLDCVAWTGLTRRRALALQAGDVVEVNGSLRRRFWSAGAAKVSRYEVEAAAVRRVLRPPA